MSGMHTYKRPAKSESGKRNLTISFNRSLPSKRHTVNGYLVTSSPAARALEYSFVTIAVNDGRLRTLFLPMYVTTKSLLHPHDVIIAAFACFIVMLSRTRYVYIRAEKNSGLQCTFIFERPPTAGFSAFRSRASLGAVLASLEAAEGGGALW